MFHAYNELYLSNAKSRLSLFFDYAINDCGMEPDRVASLFVTTGVAEQFENGNPAYLAGMSGIEMAREVILGVYGKKDLPEPRHSADRTPEYWAGWALASYQWYYARRFKAIFTRIPMSDIIKMYPAYHEMDITHFIEDMEDRYRRAEREPNLKLIRENRGLSQAELSRQAGINIRNIQMYEQRANNIDKAQGQILYKLSRVLGCDMEDLLENPMK